jgi:hypothetical protein
VKPTVQTLLDHAELALTLLTPADALPDPALTASVTWAHSSDLADPTPFLDAGHVLLTSPARSSRPTPGPRSPPTTCGVCATRASPRSASAPR